MAVLTVTTAGDNVNGPRVTMALEAWITTLDFPMRFVWNSWTPSVWHHFKRAR